MYRGADLRSRDKSDMNPFMIAVQRCHLDVVKAMIKECVLIVIEEVKPGVTMLDWALESGYSAFFEVCVHILTKKDL